MLTYVGAACYHRRYRFRRILNDIREYWPAFNAFNVSNELPFASKYDGIANRQHDFFSMYWLLQHKLANNTVNMPNMQLAFFAYAPHSSFILSFSATHPHDRLMKVACQLVIRLVNSRMYTAIWLLRIRTLQLIISKKGLQVTGICVSLSCTKLNAK